MPAQKTVKACLAHHAMHIMRHVHVKPDQFQVFAFLHQTNNRIAECLLVFRRKVRLILASDRCARRFGREGGCSAKQGFYEFLMDFLKQLQLVQGKAESENFIEGFGVKVLAGLMRMVHFFAPDKGFKENNQRNMTLARCQYALHTITIVHGG